MECPECKNKIEKPVAMDFWHLAWLFVLCILLPPLNLGLTMKYIKSIDPKAKKIGWISLAVMTIAILIGFWIATRWAQNLNGQVNKEMSKYLIGY